jgi:hypothetical protein
MRSVSLIAALICLIFANRVAVLANENASVHFRASLEKELRQVGCVMADDGRYAIFAAKVVKGRLVQPFFVLYDKDGQVEKFSWAKEAELLVDGPHHRLHLRMLDARASSADGSEFSMFECKVWSLTLPDLRKSRQR